MRRITKTIVWIGVGGALYFVSCNHFIYFGGKTVRLLKKEQPTFSRTFFSTSLKTPEQILSDDVLRDAGMGDLLVDMGLLTEQNKDYIMSKYEEED